MANRRDMHGRDRLLQQLRESLAAGSLLSLVGPGGVGKTRLALALEGRFVDLQAARTADDVARALTWTGADHADLASALASLTGVVVLDNLEQLAPDAIALVARAVEAAPHVCWIGTSRRALGVPREQVLEVPPLPLPDAGALSDSPAWRVFADASGYRGCDDPERAVRILALLDGLPLAIQLAGARLQVLDLEALEDRLRRDLFPVVAAPERRPGDRHGTLWASIAWSWDLLDGRERDALAGLARFEGPFDVGLAEAVIGGEDALDVLHRLARDQMVTRRDRHLVVLDTVRAFVRRMSSAGVIAHARAVVSEALRLCLPSADAVAAQRRLSALWPDLQAVLEAAQGDPSLVADGLDAARAMCNLLDRRGPVEGIEDVAERALALSPSGTPAIAEILRLRARWRRRTGRLGEARADLDRAHALAPGAVNILSDRADLAVSLGDFDAACAGYRQVLEISDGAQHAMARVCLAVNQGASTPEALDQARLAVEEARAIGDQALLAEVLRQAGTVALTFDAHELAIAQLTEARALAAALQVPDRILGLIDGQLGLAEELAGRYDAARDRLTDAVAAFERANGQLFASYYLAFRGRVRLASGDAVGALADLVPAIDALAGEDDQGLLPHLRSARIAARAALGVVDPEAGAAWAAVADAVRADLAGERGVTLVPPPPPEPSDVSTSRAAAAALRLAEQTLQTWRLSADASWHQPPGMPARAVSAAANARVLLELARHRLASPGAALGSAELAAAGWPGEQILPEAARNRVRVAINGLRAAGLRPLVLRDREGWFLDPHVALVIRG